MKPFNKKIRNLTLILVLLMPIYPNSELFSKTHQNILLVSEKINKREDALKEIDRLVKKTENAEKNKNFYEAISNLKKIIYLEKKFLGTNHPDLADTYTWIANIYNYENKFEKAKIFYTNALKIAEENNDPEISKAINNLALNYRYQGKYDKAEALFIRALKINEKLFGLNHPKTSLVLHNLASIYRDKGLLKKSEKLFIRALNIDKNNLGPQHPDTITTIISLGEIYQSQALYEKAESLLIESLELSKKILGPEHPKTAIFSVGDINFI